MSGTIDVAGTVVPIVWQDVHVESCADAAKLAQDEAGRAVIHASFTFSNGELLDGRYVGQGRLRMDGVRIEITHIAWPRMSHEQRTALGEYYRAILWHEIGHIQTGDDSIAQQSERFRVSTADPADYQATSQRRGQAALFAIIADQAEYDRQSDHGRAQQALPPPLRGPNIVLRC